MNKLAMHIGALRMDDQSAFLSWLSRGTRLITIYDGSPTLRTQLAAALLVKTIVFRYNHRAAERLYGYVNAPAAFDELYTQRFSDMSALKSSLYDPGMLVLTNVHDIPDASIPLFLRCVQERCDSSRVTIITTSKDGYTMLYAHDDLHERIISGRTVQL